MEPGHENEGRLVSSISASSSRRTMDGFAEVDPSGRYKRKPRAISKGGFKSIYRAYDCVDGLEVAWSKLEVDQYSEDVVQRTQREMEYLQKLRHKNIVNTYASWLTMRDKEAKTLHFVTEHMRFGNLRDYIAEARMITIKVIRKWCANILEGLVFMHSRSPPLVHRDLRCENVFLNGNKGEVKIGEMGLSTLKDGQKVFAVIGSPEIMAPELHSADYTESVKVDIYSFGMCMLQMVTMDYPYSECETPAMVLRKVFKGEKPLALLRMKEGSVKTIITQCLSSEHKRPSAQDLLNHPFFREWKDDPGLETNLELISSSPRESDNGQKEDASDDVVHGNYLVHNVPAMSRDVVISREEAPATAQSVDQDLFSRGVLPLQDKTGDVRLSVHIPVNNVTKRVEFMFNLSEDKVSDIASEMKLEFRLNEAEARKVEEEISNQANQFRENLTVQKSTSDEGGAESSNEGSSASSGHLQCHARNILAADLNSFGSSPPRGNGFLRNPTGRYSTRLSRMGSEAKIRDLNMKSLKLSMGVMQACRKGDEFTVRDGLSHGVSANFTDYDMRTPLHLAVENRHVELVAMLLDKGAKCFMRDRWGRTALSIAVDNGHEEMVELMQEHGAAIHELSSESPSIVANRELMQFCITGSVDDVKRAIMAGASVNMRDEYGATPLHYASDNTDLDIVELLLLNSANPHIKDNSGRTPIDIASRDVELLRLYMSYDVPVHASFFGEEHLRGAARGMDINAVASKGQVDKLRRILDLNADVNYKDYDRRSPLHLAATEGHVDAVKLLLDRGAEVEAKDIWGCTPLDEARRFNRSNVETLLEERITPRNGIKNITRASTSAAVPSSTSGSVRGPHQDEAGVPAIPANLICLDELKKRSLHALIEE